MSETLQERRARESAKRRRWIAAGLNARGKHRQRQSRASVSVELGRQQDRAVANCELAKRDMERRVAAALQYDGDGDHY